MHFFVDAGLEHGKGSRGAGKTAALCAMLLAGLAGLAGSAAAQDKATEYAKLMQDAATFERYNTNMQRLVQAQQQDIASLTQQVEDLDATAAEVGPLLQKMYDSLAEFVAKDLPFLPDERQQRMDRLKDLMAEDGSFSEKYRRLLEAYQIELEYGRTMSAYKGTLDDGRDAEFLHVGRVSLMYRTMDGSESGYWDAQKGAWVADARYARVINEALNVAQERTAPDLVTVPVPAAKETRL
jgi:hypothetical protein